MEDFTEYDIKPREFVNYLRYNGHHLNKLLYGYLCRLLFEVQYVKDYYINFCNNNNAVCDEKNIYDKVYLYNYYRNILYGNGIDDEQHLIHIISTILKKKKAI